MLTDPTNQISGSSSNPGGSTQPSFTQMPYYLNFQPQYSNQEEQMLFHQFRMQMQMNKQQQSNQFTTSQPHSEQQSHHLVDETEEEEDEPLSTPTSKSNRGRKKSVAKRNKGKDVEVEKETKEGRIRHAWTQVDGLLLAEMTAYLYGSLDSEIYMKLPERSESCKNMSREKYAIKLNKSLYGLKQSRRMWYNRLSEYLLKEGYKNDSVCPYIFIKRSGSEYVIIAVYVDDLNIIGTPGELPKAIECLKREFEMKDPEKTKFCFRLQIKHLKDGILVHQETYTKKLLKRFYMDKSHSLSTPMVVRILDVKKDPFRPRDVDEEILGPYLSAIGALMFLAGHTR
ncbi:retrovirus-related pol polyprotein from transposon TNT 1-94, partial [Tanacetum coccineum]